jgi:branched-subunit amino acid transport protein
MSVNVADVMNLPELEGAVLIAGEKGLKNIIRRVSFFDHDEKLFFEEYKEKEIELPGDFFITSLFTVKSSHNMEESIMNIIKHLIYFQSSGLVIVKGFIEELPLSVIEYANERDFPIFLIDTYVPYAVILTVINEKLLINKENTLLELKIDKILASEAESSEIISTMNTINILFKPFMTAIYFEFNPTKKTKPVQIYNEIIRKSEWSMIRYKKGYFILMSSSDKSSVPPSIKTIVQTINNRNLDIVIGISRTYALSNSDKSLFEAISSFRMSNIIKKNSIFFENLNVYKLLIYNYQTSESRDFHDSIIDPLVEYDKKNNTSVLKTAIAFLECGGNYKETSAIINKHENTVRNNLNKAMSILGITDNLPLFYESLSTAVKIDKLIRYF